MRIRPITLAEEGGQGLVQVARGVERISALLLLAELVGCTGQYRWLKPILASAGAARSAQRDLAVSPTSTKTPTSFGMLVGRLETTAAQNADFSPARTRCAAAALANKSGSVPERPPGVANTASRTASRVASRRSHPPGAP